MASPWAEPALIRVHLASVVVDWWLLEGAYWFLLKVPWL